MGDGISCAVPWDWSPASSFRVSVDVVLSNNPALCPPASPYNCLVYYEYVGYTSQPYARTLTSSWSLAQYVYGDLGNTDNFVEQFYFSVPDHPYCNTYPNGQFTYPHYAINGGSYYSPGGSLPGGAVGQDDLANDSSYPHCGRTYMNSWTVSTQWLVPA